MAHREDSSPAVPTTAALAANTTASDERQRLDTLRRYRILDTNAEAGFDRITWLASRLFGVPIAAVTFVDEMREWHKSCVGLDWTEASRDVGFCSQPIFEGKPLIVEDMREDPRFRDHPLVRGETGIRFYAGIPLMVDGGVAPGTLSIIDKKPRTLGSPDIEVLTELAAMVVDELELRLAKIRAEEAERALREIETNLQQRVVERTRDLEESQAEVLQRLGHAAEWRDFDMREHVGRMSRCCFLIARAAGLSQEECQLVLKASPMHDIGKIGVPDRVLLKPGKLDPEEWTIMKRHAAIGAEMLADGRTPLIEMAETFALTHHERWDGGGYPNGLQGKEIPLVGRIAAIADVFDALTSDRPYKKAWPVEQAAEEIRAQRGRHFDPDLVDVFLSVLPEIVSVY